MAVSAPSISGDRFLFRRILLPLLLLIPIAAWALNGFSVNFQPVPEKIAGNAAQDLTIREAKRSGPTTINYRLLDQRLLRLMETPDMVGLAVGIVENGEIRFLKGYGVTQAGGEAVTTDTVFRWASVSKGVAGDMVALLAAEGKIGLYDPVANYAPSLRLPGGNENRATISDLLSHRLGLFAHANDPKLESGEDAKMLRRSLATLNAICAPGTCHAYQNVAYDAASEVVEKVTGRPYREMVEERLFRPLGMTSATLTRDGLMAAASWAKPHRRGFSTTPVEVTDSYYRVPAAGGVNSSIKDLTRWMQAQMGEAPRTLPPQALQMVQSPRVATPRENRRMAKFRERVKATSYGLGWRIYDYDGHNIVAHRGGVTGYRSLIMFDPLRKTGVVALWNSGSSKPGGLEFEVMDMAYRLPRQDWMMLDQPPAAAPPLNDAAPDAGEPR